MQYAQTAVLLFTRTVSDEAAAKDFSGLHHQKANALIADKLISHALSVISASQLPSFIIDSSHQTGETFAHRFTNAIKEVFENGFDNVIAIGNDCPTLTVEDLLFSKMQLEKGGAIGGPSNDGGLYLVGLKRKFFNAKIFVTLPWCTKNILEAFEKYINGFHQTLKLLKLKSDIDGANGTLHTILHSFACPYQLRIAILCLLQMAFEKISHYKNIFFNYFIIRFSSLRAPPVY